MKKIKANKILKNNSELNKVSGGENTDSREENLNGNNNEKLSTPELLEKLTNSFKESMGNIGKHSDSP